LDSIVEAFYPSAYRYYFFQGVNNPVFRDVEYSIFRTFAALVWVFGRFADYFHHQDEGRFVKFDYSFPVSQSFPLLYG
jgi:hypothetical protein